METGIAFAFGIGFIALIASLVRASRLIRDAQYRIERVTAAKETQVERIRKLAKATLALRREIRQAERRHTLAEEDCKSLEEKLRAEMAVDRRVYVLDDRRTPSDRTWLALIINNDLTAFANPHAPAEVIASWRAGRRFVVWALDEKKAREKILLRFSDRGGYSIRVLRERPGKSAD